MYEVIERRQYDLGCKRQRRRYSPRRDGAVIRSVRDPSVHIIEEVPHNAIHFDTVGTGTIACGNSPAMAAIALELQRVSDGILLLRISCTPAVFEIVDPFITHESVLNTTEVDPDMGELVREQ